MSSIQKPLITGMLFIQPLFTTFILTTDVYAVSPTKVRLAAHYVPAAPPYKLLVRFFELTQKGTGGQVVGQVYGSGVLGSESTAVRAMMQGNVEMAACSTSNIGVMTEKFLFADLPYLFDSHKQQIRFYEETAVGKEVVDSFEKEFGVKLLMLFANGNFSNIITTKKQVKVPEDVKGLRLRARDTLTEMSLMKAWGAAPVSMSYVETHQAEQQGVIDGQFLQYPDIPLDHHNETCKYISEVKAVMSPLRMIMISRKVWDSFSAENKEIIMKTAKQVQTESLINNEQDVKDAKDFLIKYGNEIYTPSAAELEKWKKASMPLYDMLKEKIKPEFVYRVREAIAGR